MRRENSCDNGECCWQRQDRTYSAYKSCADSTRLSAAFLVWHRWKAAVVMVGRLCFFALMVFASGNYVRRWSVRSGELSPDARCCRDSISICALFELTLGISAETLKEICENPSCDDSPFQNDVSAPSDPCVNELLGEADIRIFRRWSIISQPKIENSILGMCLMAKLENSILTREFPHSRNSWA